MRLPELVCIEHQAHNIAGTIRGHRLEVPGAQYHMVDDRQGRDVERSTFGVISNLANRGGVCQTSATLRKTPHSIREPTISDRDSYRAEQSPIATIATKDIDKSYIKQDRAVQQICDSPFCDQDTYKNKYTRILLSSLINEYAIRM